MQSVAIVWLCMLDVDFTCIFKAIFINILSFITVFKYTFSSFILLILLLILPTLASFLSYFQIFILSLHQYYPTLQVIKVSFYNNVMFFSSHFGIISQKTFLNKRIILCHKFKLLCNKRKSINKNIVMIKIKIKR